LRVLCPSIVSFKEVIIILNHLLLLIARGCSIWRLKLLP
jgi:hypothetical protein